MRIARPIGLSEEQRAKLTAYARGRSVAKRGVERASIVLQAAEGKQGREIAADLGMGRHTVARWRARFLERPRNPLIRRLLTPKTRRRG